MNIHIYAQHTRNAGQLCQDDELIERSSDDIFTLEGTPRELSAHAELLKAAPARAGRDIFNRCVANAIEEAIGAESP